MKNYETTNGNFISLATLNQGNLLMTWKFWKMTSGGNIMRDALIFAPPFSTFTFPPMSITKYTMKNKMSRRVALILVESTLNSMLHTHMDV